MLNPRILFTCQLKPHETGSLEIYSFNNRYQRFTNNILNYVSFQIALIGSQYPNNYYTLRIPLITYRNQKTTKRESFLTCFKQSLGKCASSSNTQRPIQSQSLATLNSDNNWESSELACAHFVFSFQLSIYCWCCKWDWNAYWCFHCCKFTADGERWRQHPQRAAIVIKVSFHLSQHAAVGASSKRSQGD